MPLPCKDIAIQTAISSISNIRCEGKGYKDHIVVATTGPRRCSATRRSP